MKTILLILSLCLPLSGFSAGIGFLRPQVRYGLVGHWTLNEGTGTTISDSSLTNTTGYLTNAPTWTTGVVGRALQFDGSTSHASMGDVNSVEGISNLTVAAWIYPNLTNTRGIIVAKDESGQRSWYLSKSDTSANNTIRFAVGAADAFAYTTTSVLTGAWTHVAATYSPNEPTNSRILIYINGVVETPSSYLAPQIIVPATTSFLQIGSRQFTGSRQFFNGRIDDVRIYDRAISADEVKQLYGGGYGSH